MSSYVPGFQSFFRISLHIFVSVKLVTYSIKVKSKTYLAAIVVIVDVGFTVL